MGLMFLQYFVDKQENRLLSEVDVQTRDLLAARFPASGSAEDPQMHAVRHMAEAVIGAVERTVARQAELWGKTIHTAEQRWTEVTNVGRDQLEEAFGRALSKSIDVHRKHLLAAEEAAAEKNRTHWQGVQQSLEACAAGVRAQQGELTRHGDTLLRVVEATNHVSRLEDSLNHNLASLSASQHLQETLINLSAAVGLLNARLERLAPAAPFLSASSSASKAA
jgi:hypothetical protein